jgi:vitamin B12 transporter
MISPKNYSLSLLNLVLSCSLLLVSHKVWSQNPNPVIEEMTITASRTEMPLRQVGASVSVLTAEDLEKKSFPALADVLRTLPSIDVTRSGGVGKAASVRIRGEEAYRTLLLIDGINVSDSSGVQAMPHFGHVLNSQLGRVEVLRGPQGMMYGADAGGVVSIFSKQSDELIEVDLGAEAGRYDTRRIDGNVRGAFDRLKYSLTASNLSSDGFNALEDDPTADADGYKNTTVHGTAEFSLTENSGLGLVLRNTDGKSQYDQCFSSDFSTSFDCSEEYSNRSGKLDWHYSTDEHSHEVTYQQSTTERVDVTADEFDNAMTFEGELDKLQYLGRWSIAEDLGVVFGADHQTDSYLSSFDQEESKRDQSGVFAEGQVSFDDTLFYTVGLRHDDNEDFGEHLSYRLTAAYLLPINSSEIKFKGSYGTGFRAPSLYELGYNNGPFAAPYVPRNLVEETSQGYELGVEWHFAADTFVELVWFDNRIEDEIFFDMAGFGGYLQSEGETTSRGVEFNGSAEVVGNLVIAGNYTYNDTALSDDTTVVGAEPGDQRARRPKHLYNLSANYAFWQDRINLAASYRNSQDAVDYSGGGQIALGDHEVVDLTGSWLINDSLEAYLRWENALDEEYQEVAGYNTSGSAGYLGVRVSF